MLKVLEIVGIVIVSLIVLFIIIFCAVLFLPVRYCIGGSNKDKLYAFFRISIFFSALRIKVYYHEKMGYVALRILGIKLYDKSFPDTIDFLNKVSDILSKIGSKKKKDNDLQNEDSQDSKDDCIESIEEELGITVDEAEEFLNEHDEIEDMGPLKKRISFVKWLKDIVLNIKKKWYNLKDFIRKKIEDWNKFRKYVKFYWHVLQCPSLQPSLELLIKVSIDVCKHIFPKKWKMKIVFGDEDPYINAKVYGYICATEGLFNKSIDFTPVFGENILKIDGYVKGYIQSYIMLNAAFKIFSNKHIRRMIKLVRKGGHIGGRS